MITRCNVLSAHKIVVVSENRREFRIDNSSLFKINKVTVDACYITAGLRCDYLFEVIEHDAINKVCYVELKGTDIKHAVQQLAATIKHCNTIHACADIKKESYIVASKFPKSSTSSQKFKKEFKRIHKMPLYIDTNKKEITV